MKRQSDSVYSKKHDEKTKAKQIPFKLYLAKEDEEKIFNWLDGQENKKSYLIDLIKEDMRKNGIAI